MNNQNSFIMYIDYDKHFQYLSKEELADLILAIWEWQRSGTEPNGLTNATMIAFSFIRQDMEQNNQKWLKEKEARSNAGKKGMQNRWNGEKNISNDNETYQSITNDCNDNKINNKNNNVNFVANNEYQNITNIADNVNVNVNDNVNDIKEKNIKKKFGKFLNVCLFDFEYKKLISEFGEDETNSTIDDLSTYMESSGKVYKNHYATLINFFKRNKEMKKIKPFKNTRKYSEKDFQSLFTDLNNVKI